MERQLDFFCFLGKHIHVFCSKPSELCCVGAHS